MEPIDPQKKDLKQGWSLIPHKSKKARSDETGLSIKKKEDYNSKRSRREDYHSKRSRRSVSLSSLPSIDENKITLQPTIPTPAFITAVRNDDSAKIDFYLSNPWFNPNIHDQWLNTAAHFAVMSKNLNLIRRFCEDFRFDFSKRNKHRMIPMQCADENEHVIRRLLFPRTTLDIHINQQAPKMLPKYLHGEYDATLLDAKVQKIIIKINNDKITQSIELPEETLLQVTPEYIRNMLLFRTMSLTQPQ